MLMRPLLFIGCFLLAIYSSFAKQTTLDINAKGQKLSLAFWPCEAKQQRGAILLLAGGESWEGNVILLQLAPSLAKMGWSVAIFDLANQTKWAEQLPDIFIALKKGAGQRIVLIHYGSHLQELIDYFSQLQAKRVNGLVLLSAFDEKASELNLKKIVFPILDVIAQFDYETVKAQLKQRQSTALKGKYKKITLPGAPHDYLYYEKSLIAFLHAWMRKLPETNRIASPL